MELCVTIWQNKKLAIVLWPSNKGFWELYQFVTSKVLTSTSKRPSLPGSKVQEPLTPTPTQLLFRAQLGRVSCARVLESKMWLKSATEIPGASTEGTLPVSAIGAGLGEGTGQLSLKSSVKWERRLRCRTWTWHPLWPSPPGAPGAELGKDLKGRLIPTSTNMQPSPSSPPSRASTLMETCPGIQRGSDLALGKAGFNAK